MEQVIDCGSLEEARNKAVKKLEELLGSSLGPYVKVVVGKDMGGSSPLAGTEVGVEYRSSKAWGRIRLDFDPNKGPHYNVETRSEAWAFCFPASSHEGAGGAWASLGEEEKAAVQQWMRGIGQRRGTR
ncbi:hypothetical protein [Polyangium spumosum]|uniref:Uncharacterized protein n=1 Tax=Polyangium spumosum TaxID=889282 RepID=A0A6N7PYZ4_9BACT|nr:hypothetical protein [Polyangium spumosum]MRG95700.1 hypothetical protein [Polyangium spumosum]